MTASVQPNLYQGFGKLEDLINSHPKNEKLMLAVITESGRPDNLGVAYERVWITAQDLEEGRVRYCRILAGGYGTINGGEGFPPERAEQTRARALECFEIVADYIRRQGIEVLEHVTIAAPAELKLPSGFAGFLSFNKETGRFELVEVVP